MKGFKTVAFNVVMGILFFAGAPDAVSEAQLTEALNAGEAGFTAVWSVGNIVLRAITDTPIFRRD